MLGYIGRALDIINFPGESPEVQDAESSHFDAEEHGGDTNFNIGHLESLGGLDGSRGSQKGDHDLAED